MYNNRTHATMTLPKPQVHAQHPLVSTKNHEKLLEYLQQRLSDGKNARDDRLPRMVNVDKTMAGWMKLSDEDRDRARQADKTGVPQALTMNLPLTLIHIDDMITYLVSIFAPNKGMFDHSGDPKDTPTATQIITLMNNHAIYSGYYRQVVLTCLSLLKYNIGGFFGRWAADSGPRLSQPAPDSPPVRMNEVIWQGNKLESLDMYNTFWDPSVQAHDVYRAGEWAARAFIKSHYWLKKEASNGIYFNVEDMLAQDQGIAQCQYYRHPPAEAHMAKTSDSGGTDWMAILSETPTYSQKTGFEFVEMFIWLNPTDFGLVPASERATRNRYEIWRFTLLNDERIIDATYMNNIHNYLPFFMGSVNDDLMEESQKSVAEVLKPLQDFASFLLNTHVKATRKNIWGLTVYDPTMVDLKKIPEGEVSARVPLKPAGQGKDIRQMIWQNDQVLDTRQTMQDLGAVMDIISQFFPTQLLPSQIAGIDRAVNSQVAAVMQGATRRMHKMARLLDDSLFRPLRFSFYYNIIQYQPDGAMVSDFYGKPIKVNLAELRETDLPFIIGQGLKALDKQAAAQALQQIIFAIIQNPQVAQQIDLLGLIDYWAALIDVQVDMRQFRIQQQPAGIGDNGGPPLDDAGVQPITDPAQMGTPLA